MRRRLSSLLLLTVACALGDYSGGTGHSNTGQDGGTNGGGTVPGDLPCDVATLLSAHCTSCHGTPPTGSAPMPLDSHAALTATSTSYPGLTYAQRSLVRMRP